MPLPDIATVDRQQAPSEWPVLHFSQATDASQEVALVEGCDATAVDLTDTFQVKFYAKDHLFNTTLYVDVEAPVVTANPGVIRVDVPADTLYHPGVFYGEFALFLESPETPGDPADNPYKRLPCYMEVTQSLDANPPSANYGLRIAEVRMAMWDRCPEDNFLLEAVMFSDAQIAFAIQRPVDMWNEMMPPVPPVYSAADFPYRYNWTNATIAELYGMAAHSGVRNSLTYQAHGVTVGDKDKFQYYLAIGREMKAEFKQWALQTKASRNAMNAMGSAALYHYG